MSDINKQSTPNQMRHFIRNMNNVGLVNEYFDKSDSKDMNMRDLLKITRKLNENEESANMKTMYDQKQEEDKFLNNFRDMTVNVKFIELEVYDDLVFWGGTVDGIIQFVYKVTPDESTSGVEFNYLEDFSPDNPDNEEIVNRIEGYYNSFYKYWQNNVIQK